MKSKFVKKTVRGRPKVNRPHAKLTYQFLGISDAAKTLGVSKFGLYSMLTGRITATDLAIRCYEKFPDLMLSNIREKYGLPQ